MITLDEDWVHGEVPLSKPPLTTAWAGVQAAGAAAGRAAAELLGSTRAAAATTVRTPMPRALWGVGLTRYSFCGGRDPGRLEDRRTGWGAPGRP
ncbi:hypothetical protein ACE1SV_73140 [Streptomyces sennicomposti]